MDDGEIIGTTKISDRWRISLIKDVREELDDMGHDAEIGDKIVFRRDGDRIVIEPS